jgi:hypothetical protein
VLIHDNSFARCFRLAIPDYLIYYRSHDVDACWKGYASATSRLHQWRRSPATCPMPWRQSTRSRPSRKLAKISILDALWEDLLKRLRQTDADLFPHTEQPGDARSQARVGARKCSRQKQNGLRHLVLMDESPPCFRGWLWPRDVQLHYQPESLRRRAQVRIQVREG